MALAVVSSSRLSNGRICIRPLEFGDTERVRLWRNKDNIRCCFIYDGLITAEQQVKWWDKYVINEKEIMFMIEELPKRSPVGVVSLYNIEQDKAEFGRLMIGEESALGKGYGLQATELAVNYGFSVLNLDMIYLEVFKNNVYAQNIYKKAGFEITGEDGMLYKMCLYRKS